MSGGGETRVGAMASLLGLIIYASVSKGKKIELVVMKVVSTAQL